MFTSNDLSYILSGQVNRNVKTELGEVGRNCRLNQMIENEMINFITTDTIRQNK